MNKKTLNSVVLIALLAILATTAQTSKGQNNNFEQPRSLLSEPFLVVQVTPTNASNNVIADTVISVTFNQPVNPASVSHETFVVRGSISGKHGGTFGVDNALVQFDAAQNFEPGEEIFVSLTKNILTEDGTRLSPNVWSFHVATGGGTGFFYDSGEDFGGSNGIAVLGDLDKDGDLDAFSVGLENSKIFFNDGAGHFIDSGQTLINSWGWRVALGDLDDDGDLDAFVANHSLGQTVWKNDGFGIFTNTGQVLGNGHTYGLALGDMDGDGDLDVVAANYNGNDLWVNNGDGVFTDSGQNLGEYGMGVALGDIDYDGDLDAFFVNDIYNTEGHPATVWINNGLGVLSDSGQRLGLSEGSDVAMGDFDGDGDLDAFAVYENNLPDKLWLNDGSGLFTDSGQNLGATRSLSLAIGDLDNDGDLDAFVAVGYQDGDEPQSNMVWLNDGNGTFEDRGQDFGSLYCGKIVLGDVDNDNDLDALGSYADSQANILWLNDQYYYKLYIPLIMNFLSSIFF